MRSKPSKLGAQLPSLSCGITRPCLALATGGKVTGAAILFLLKTTLTDALDDDLVFFLDHHRLLSSLFLPLSPQSWPKI